MLELLARSRWAPNAVMAVAAAFGSTLRPGDTLVMPFDSYYTSRLLAQGFFAQIGVHVRKAPTADGVQAQCLDGAKLLWLETPTNPGLDVCDIAALTDAAHREGVLVAVDNTTATVVAQRPLELGADFSVASDTKALTGHSDLVLGHVAVRDSALADKIRSWRTQIGAIRDRWKCGWPIARLPRWRCAWKGSAATHWLSLSNWPPAPMWRAYAIPVCRVTRHMRLQYGRCNFMGQ
jgi:cystathionine gamma-lyase